MEKKRKIQIVIGACLMVSSLVFAYVSFNQNHQETNDQVQKIEQEKKLKSEDELWKSKNFGKKLEPLTFEN